MPLVGLVCVLNVNAQEPAKALPPVQDVAVAAGTTTEGPPVRQPEVAGKPVTLFKALQLALTYNSQIQIAGVTQDIAQQKVREAGAVFEPTFQMKGGYEQSKKPLNTQDFVQSGLAASRSGNLEGRVFASEVLSYSAGLAGRLPWGTQYDLGIKGNRLKNDINQRPPSLFYPEYDAFAGLTVTQPLLRGRGPNANLAGVNIAKKDHSIAQISRTLKQDEVAELVVFRYCDTAFALGDLAVKDESLKLAEALRTVNERRLKQGVDSALEVYEAAAAAAYRLDELHVARARLIESQTALRLLFEDPDVISSMPPTEPPLPTERGRLFQPKLDRSQMLTRAFLTRGDYRQIKLEAEKQDIEIRYAKNQTWPQLDLKATGGLLGLGSSTTGAFDRANDGNTPMFGVFLEFSVPLGGDLADSRLQAAKLKKFQILQAMKQLELDIVTQIDSQMAIVRLQGLRISDANNAVQLTRQRLDAEMQKLENGTSTSFAVLQFQKDVSAARTQELAAISDFNRSVARLYSVQGILLTELGLKKE